MLTILFFGPVAERAGTRQLHLPYRAEQTLAALQNELAARYPEAFALVCAVAVNGEQAHDASTPLADGSEVVFMSAFSGG